MNRPDAAHTNPVVAKTNAIVLCLHCFGDNSDQFKFCQHCGKQPSQTLKGVSAVRLFGSQGSAQLNPKMKLNIADKFNSFLAYKATSQNSKAIVSIMKSFERFLFSFGLSKFANSEQPRLFNVLDANDADVVNFCIWKSLSGVGRTYLHCVQCPLLGDNIFTNDCIKMGCERMIAAEYLRTGVISKLREGFRSVGLTSTWSERTSTGNPALSRLVMRYLKMVQEQQAKAGVTQKQAAIFLKQQLRTLLSWLALFLALPEFADVVSQFEIRMIRSFLSTAFASSKRCDDVCWVLTKKVFRLPNNVGLIVNFQFGKTLRQLPNHVFGLAPDKANDPWFCPVKLMDSYVDFGNSIGVDMSVGFLYTRIDVTKHRHVDRLSPAYVNARFRFYLARAGMENCNQGDLKLSIQSLRAGSAITKLLEGQSLKKVMSDAYWKNPSTAWRYIKLLQVFFPFRDFGLELDALCPEDYAKLNSTPLTQQGKWFQAFPSLENMFEQTEIRLMHAELGF